MRPNHGRVNARELRPAHKQALVRVQEPDYARDLTCDVARPAQCQ